MKYNKLFLACAGAVALLCQAGCGSYDLKSIQLSASQATTTGGFFELKGEGGTLQLQAIGNYSNNTTKDITPRVTFTVTPDGTDALGNSLQAPPATMTVSPTGLLTAVDPFVCSYVNTGTTSQPTWALSGSYKITATFNGVTSQPVYIGVASAIDDASGQCGP
ncbi:MAG TPA: hypothetical protein VI386_16840 [Candidatus Sulfotelmatobacter sp.]